MALPILAAALVSSSILSSALFVVAGSLLLPIVAILQGIIGIIRYRLLYSDAPFPLSPAYGVVVVKPEASDSISQDGGKEEIDASCDVDTQYSSTGCCCPGGQSWRSTFQLCSSEQQLLDKALEDPPLRLLVIGDSLSVGVGTSQSCTPVMPEVIARTLSKSLNGRAVYWTCHGEPGASAGWVVRELERGIGSSRTRIRSCGSMADTSISSSSSCDDNTAESDTFSYDDNDEERNMIRKWSDRLQQHRESFDHPHGLEPCDVVVIFSGANDLKGGFFPFLLSGEDVHFRKQAKERGGSYVDELRLVLDVLRRRMEKGIDVATGSPVRGQRQQDFSENDATSGPLIVLPGLAARALPIFRRHPLRWFAVPVVDKLDNHKRSLAETHLGDVLFVDPPTVAGLEEYEDRRGQIWAQRKCEDTLLSLRDVDRSTCRRIANEMREYYESTDNHEVKVLNQACSVKSQHHDGGKLGSRLFSPDGVHPADDGYDYWGRHIGLAIATELQKSL